MNKEKLLLTQEEGEAAVEVWVKADWSTRAISLNCGHWEHIVPVIAQAQVAKIKSLGGVITAGSQAFIPAADWWEQSVCYSCLARHARAGFCRVEEIE